MPNAAQADQDADGSGDACDCVPSNDVVYPGAPELCDGLNNDCNDPTWPAVPAAEADVDGDMWLVCEGDCDDAVAALHPGATELCNGADDDCDALVDEDELGFDTDSDGVHNACDNCRTVANAAQTDSDADRAGNACDNCPLDSNREQADVDHDAEGDVCDLDDGLILIRFHQPTLVEWQQEIGFASWNSYRGSLAVLRATGVYTQAPGSNPLAQRDCGLASPADGETVVPAAGDVAFWLVTGVSGGVEGSLGTNSAGAPRPNANPCP